MMFIDSACLAVSTLTGRVAGALYKCTSAISSDVYAILRGTEPTGGGGARKPLGSLAPRDAGAPKIQYANPALT